MMSFRCLLSWLLLVFITLATGLGASAAEPRTAQATPGTGLGDQVVTLRQSQ